MLGGLRDSGGRRAVLVGGGGLRLRGVGGAGGAGGGKGDASYCWRWLAAEVMLESFRAASITSWTLVEGEEVVVIER